MQKNQQNTDKIGTEHSLPELLFETSWEVCNKVGGIYTVLSTKAKTLHNLYGDSVIFIGPDVWTPENPSPVFTPVGVRSLQKWAKEEAPKLPYGIKVRIGRWEIPGRPIAILVDFNPMYAHKEQFYGMMWEKYGVDSLHAYGDYDEASAFALSTGMVIESIVKFKGLQDKPVIAHFDEWTTSMGLLYTKAVLPNIATVFTTHATSIGRSICGNNKPLYGYLKGYNGDQMAGELNMQSKHSAEKAAAHQSDAFTTVSEVTARECDQLLERRPDVVTPNGFENDFVPSDRQYPAARKAARDKILQVVKTLTGVELKDDTFIIATSGRCEYRNKGIDLFLDSMARLRDADPEKQVLALVMVPAWVRTCREDLKNSLKSCRNIGLTDPIITHELNNQDQDTILTRIRQLGFSNNGDSKVMVVDVPCYLNGSDGIFDMSYYQLLPGLDATVFPSYYEPWGYTPLESVAFGVPTITTTLAGFGCWVEENFPQDMLQSGVEIVKRDDFNYDQAKEEIVAALLRLIAMDDKQRNAVRAKAQDTAQAALWTNFIQDYVEAYDIALGKHLAKQQLNII